MKKFLFMLFGLLVSNFAKADYSPYMNWEWSKPYIDEETNLSTKEATYIEELYKGEEEEKSYKILCPDFEKYRGFFSVDEGEITIAHSCISYNMLSELNGSQISAVVGYNLYNIIDFLYPYSNTSTPKYYNAEYKLEYFVRLYNIITHNNWPECPYETGKHFDNISDEPCNEDGEIIKKCRQEDGDIIICMQKGLWEKFEKLAWSEYHEKILKRKRSSSYDRRAKRDMFDVLGRTYKAIASVVEEPEEQRRQIIRMYNFYDLMMDQVHKMMVERVSRDP